MHPEAPVIAALVARQRLVRDGIETLLRRQGWAISASTPLFRDLERSFQKGATAQVLILVNAVPGDAGEEHALQFVREAAPEMRTVGFFDSDTDPAVLDRVVAIGVDALLPLDVSGEVLVEAIQLVLLGETFMFTGFADGLLARPATVDEAPPPDLTAREIEIIRLLTAGLPNRAIADRMGWTEPAVKVQIRKLLRKLGAANRTQVAIWAMRRGWLNAPSPVDHPGGPESPAERTTHPPSAAERPPSDQTLDEASAGPSADSDRRDHGGAAEPRHPQRPRQGQEAESDGEPQGGDADHRGGRHRGLGTDPEGQ